MEHTREIVFLVVKNGIVRGRSSQLLLFSLRGTRCAIDKMVFLLSFLGFFCFFCDLSVLNEKGRREEGEEERRTRRDQRGSVVDRLWGITCERVSHCDIFRGMGGRFVLAVVLEVATDEVSGGKCGHQRELSGQHRGADNATQLGGVVSGRLGVCTADSKHLEACALLSLIASERRNERKKDDDDDEDERERERERET